MIGHFSKILLTLGISALLAGCATSGGQPAEVSVHQYANLLDASQSPGSEPSDKCWFSDQGSWMGFTLPEKGQWINGFCGPFNFEYRHWVASTLADVGFTQNPQAPFHPDSVAYFPGELYMRSVSKLGKISQRLFFIDESTALIECVAENRKSLHFSGNVSDAGATTAIDDNSCTFTLPSGNKCRLIFPENAKILGTKHGYSADVPASSPVYVVIFFANNQLMQSTDFLALNEIIPNARHHIAAHYARWNGYLAKVLRPDMPEKFNRIAVKAVMTLVTNWRRRHSALFHDGIIPSHAVDYFMGFWAWDSWKHAAALAYFAPQLAKDQIRAMFDYQMENGMVPDCICPNIRENNARNSKPPLAAWAVYRVYEETADTAFVQEMFPQLLDYYHWWYSHRDHNANGLCEYGAVDGNLDEATWESGMNKAIRFDNARMVQNSDSAWSLNQESVDLNAFLAYEHRLLKKLASVAGQNFDEADYAHRVGEYFFDRKAGFFFDRRFDGSFVNIPACEGFIPLWTKIASPAQAFRIIHALSDSDKFGTYIPFPTVAVDVDEFSPRGYWRGAVWLDQSYFAISGLRKYGYRKLADDFTARLFDRLKGLSGSAPIYENYESYSGRHLQTPHVSWAAAHLLMLYEEYGKILN